MTKFKNTVKIFAMVISILMIIWYLASTIINIGSLTGIVFFGIILTYCLLSLRKPNLFEKQKDKKAFLIINELVAIVFAVVLMYTLTVVSFMAYAANRQPDENATVVVLGCQVRGTQPSALLNGRIEAAYQYLTAHPQAQCIASGGKGDNEDISEAQCIYNELVKKGIDSFRITLEDKSTNTEENIQFSKKLMESKKLNPKMAIVTDEYHELRAAIIAQKNDISCGAVPARTQFRLLANFATREVLAVTAEVISF